VKRRASGYFKLTADQNLPEGQSSYAFCLENGKVVETDLAKATKYLQSAADQDFAFEQFIYAMYHIPRERKGLVADAVEAAKYHRLLV
jgi:TPR repeat protein